MTKNEEKEIRGCLEDIKDLVDEIIIVDDFSTDKTVEICREYTDLIYQHKYNNFAEQRNLSLSKATGDWILVIDADERLSPELKEFLQNRSQLLNSNDCDAYAFRRLEYVTPERWLKHGMYPDYLVRLFRNKGEIRYKGYVHEKPTVDVNRVKKIDLNIIHKKEHPGKRWNLKGRWLAYDKLMAREMLDTKKPEPDFVYLLRGIGGFLRAFARAYFYKMGFLDGYYGLKVASFYSLSFFMRYFYLIKMKRTK